MKAADRLHRIKPLWDRNSWKSDWPTWLWPSSSIVSLYENPDAE